jgi:hypothetical protein
MHLSATDASWQSSARRARLARYPR